VDLVLEQVFLVQEKDDGGVDEPLIVADGVKQFHALHHPIHLFIFSKNEVVAGEGDAEDDGSDSLKAVDPLLPL